LPLSLNKLYHFLITLFVVLLVGTSLQVYAQPQVQISDIQKKYLAELGEIIICVDPQWMPFEIINTQGKYEGILADYVQLFSKHLATPFVLFPTSSYQESLKALKKGSCQLIVADIATAKIKADFLATDVYFVSTRAFAVHKDAPFVDDFSKKIHKPNGVVSDTPVENLLPQLYPGINVVSVASVEEGLNKVASGELYSLVNVIGVLSYSLQNQSITNVKIGGVLPGGTPFSMIVNRDYEPLVGIINSVIPLITEQNRKQIFERWVAIEYVKGIDWVFFWSVIGGILVLAGTIVFVVITWNRTLRHEIQRRKVAEEKLLYLAMVDSLTGLANRNKFYQKLDETLMYAERQNITVALAAIDLDNFKSINDQYGHPAGDIVLTEAAHRLESSCREIDMVARLGGDEFFIIIVDHKTENGLKKLGDRILTNFTLPIHCENKELIIGVSIGFAIYKEHAACKDALVSYADKALYEAKRKGKNTFCIYQSNEKVTSLTDEITT